MKQIHITRDSSGKVNFETVSIDVTETFFFTNLDTQQPHWPTLATNQVGQAPSANSSACTPIAGTPPFEMPYTCQIPGHENESGLINVFAELAAAANTTLAPATKGTAIQPQQVVVGGMSPYAISGELFQITDSNNNVIQSGSGIGPGLQLNASTDNTGISVTGTPTVSGTYNFTFTVNDAMGKNLQQVQYTMIVA